MAGFDLEAFISAPNLEQLDKCRKDDLISIAAHFQIYVLKQQLKREIKNIVLQKLVELGVLVLPEVIEDGSLASDIRPELGEEEQSGTAEVEGSEAKAVLPPFEPFSPASAGSGVDARLKVRLARVQMDARERAEDRQAERELRLKIRRLEIEAEMQIKMRELDLKAAKSAPAPVVPVPVGCCCSVRGRGAGYQL